MRISPKQLLQGMLYLTPIALLALASCGGGGGGGGSTTTPVVAPSTAPTASTPVAGCNAINLNWSAVAGATGYNVYGAASNVLVISPGNKLTATPDTATSYTDTSATMSTRYYRITAANSAGEGPGSNLVSGATTGGSTNVGGSIQGNVLTPLSNAVSTLAGTAPNQGYINDTGAKAQFNTPAGVTTDGTNLYVADAVNNVIRKIVISTGVVTTLAGAGPSVPGDGTNGDDGTGTGAKFHGPQGITINGTTLYVADTQSGTIRAITASGVVSTISSGFSAPAAITYRGPNLYVANTGSNNIVQLATNGATSGVLPTTVPAPQGITSDGTDLYVTSGSNIAKITTGGASTVVSTTPNSSQGITTDGTNLYVSNSANHTILWVAKTGVTTALIAGALATPGSADGTGSNARFHNPNGITTDGTNLYIVDTANNTIRKIQ